MRRCLTLVSKLARRPRTLLVTAVGLILLGLGIWIGGRYLWADYHYRAAQAALETYHPEVAREHLNASLTVWPESVPVRLLAARAARQAGDLDAAEEHLAICERFPEEQSEEAAVESMLLRVEAGSIDPVEEQLYSLVEQGHPRTPLILEALTRGYLRMYRLVEARSCLGYWLRQDPENVQALFLRGKMWTRVHDFRRAAADYQRVVDRAPDRDDARLLLANSLLQNSKPRPAIQELRRLQQRQPNNPDVLVRLAFALNSQGQTDEARSILDALLTEHPRHAPALKGRGQLALQSGRAEEAEGWLRRALAYEPFDRQANFLLCRCLDQQGNISATRAQRARLKRIETSLERVIEIGNRQMPMNPHDPSLHCELGTIFLGIGREELGVCWLYSALREDAGYSPAHKALADYFRKRGHAGDADRAAYHRRQLDRGARPVSASARVPE
jgi:tetratricopeptide (TPR) repeat protein